MKAELIELGRIVTVSYYLSQIRSYKVDSYFQFVGLSIFQRLW